MRLNLPIIDKVLLLGGGRLLLSLASKCKSKNISVRVITSPRHSLEIIEQDKNLKDLLIDKSIPYLITEDISSEESIKFISRESSTFYLSIGSAWIFKKEIIDKLFKGYLFNLHGSRLPQNRGGGGFSWQIMMGNRLGFCQLHLIEPGIDTGEIVKTKEFLFPSKCRIPRDYESVYFQENFCFVLDFILEIRQKEIKIDTTRQTEYFSTYWPRLNTKQNAWIDWTEKVASLERYICAFDEPYEGAKTFLNGKKVFIKDVMVDFSDPHFHSYQSGIIYRKNMSWIMVCVKGGSLIINKVLDEFGENLLDKLMVGDRFITPQSFIETRYIRVMYTPNGVK